LTIDKDNTTIVAGAGKATEIEGRIKAAPLQVEETPRTTQGKLQFGLRRFGGLASACDDRRVVLVDGPFLALPKSSSSRSRLYAEVLGDGLPNP